MDSLAKLLIFVGGVIVVLGVVLLLAPKIPYLGRLPGDFAFRRDGFSFYFPLATSIIISLILTVVLNIVLRIFRG